MQVQEKIRQLRQKMKQYQIDAYLIVSDDFHSSEYVSAFFKAREYMSGFTGSAGAMVVLPDVAALWTDGRYFLQAETQLRDSGIVLMRDGRPGTPGLIQYLCDHVEDGGVIGFDGRTVTYRLVTQILQCAGKKRLQFVGEHDLVGEIWTDRPPLPANEIWELPVSYAGCSREEKLTRIRACMDKQQADVLLLTALDEIAWLLNLRGGDVAYSPVFLSYLVVRQESVLLYVNPDQLSGELVLTLSRAGVTIRPYDRIYDDIRTFTDVRHIWADASTVNYKLMVRIPDAVEIDTQTGPVAAIKAVKNETEREHIRHAHIIDGVAVTKFIYWLKTRVGHEPVTELSAAQKLLALRRQQEGFLDQSFSPIIGYADHGAIVHYEADAQSAYTLAPRGLCLCDTGAQYREGTTDITRTIVLGPLTEEEKKAYTLVLKGHFNLASAKFLYGTCGQNLDYLAREPLWQEGLDYRHGTGHGVGYLLNVHEGPQTISWRIGKERPAVVLEEGMVISDEPGVYAPGRFGVRHENLLLCVNAEQTEYGQFMQFETLTLVPFDRAGVDTRLLEEKDIRRLNAYHARVYETLAPYLEEPERAWLRRETAPIEKISEDEEDTK